MNGRRLKDRAKPTVADKIDLRIAPATETLQSLIDDGLQESFDLIFIDADKENYDACYEMGLTLLKPGGLALARKRA